MSVGFLQEASATFDLSRLLIAAWLALSTAQWLVAAPIFADAGILPASILAGNDGSRILSKARRSLSVRHLRILLLFQAAAIVGLVVSPSPAFAIGALLLLLLTHGLQVVLAGAFWSDGADKIGIIALAGTVLNGCGIVLHDPMLAFSGILLTGGQLVLCYCVAGVSKIAIADWRSGAELTRLMATDLWGTAWARRLIRHRGAALAATWAVLLLEACFPLTLFAPRSCLIAALGGMLLFHLATAVIMKLNLFPWAFVAAYPAVLLLGAVIRQTIG